jgi:hypothetical protein
MQFEPRPIAVVPGLRRSVDREPEHVAVKTYRRRHIENLEQRANPVNFHGPILLLGAEIYHDPLGCASDRYGLLNFLCADELQNRIPAVV